MRVEANLSVPGHDGIWAVGDVAASDPLRSTARNNGAQLVARNIVRSLRGRGTRAWRSPSHVWGSVLGPLHDGLHIFLASGGDFRYSLQVNDLLERQVVSRLIYRGVRAE